MSGHVFLILILHGAVFFFDSVTLFSSYIKTLRSLMQQLKYIISVGITAEYLDIRYSWDLLAGKGWKISSRTTVLKTRDVYE